MSTLSWNLVQEAFLADQVYAGLVITSPNQEHVAKMAALMTWLERNTGRRNFTFFKPTFEGPKNSVVSGRLELSNGIRVAALEEEVLIAARLYVPELW